MKRRDFLSSALALSLPAAGLRPALAGASACGGLEGAAARLGLRLSHSAPADRLAALRACLPGPTRPALASLAPAIAEDFRAGRTQSIAGVSFSETEAAWFLHAFEAREAAL